MDNADSLTNQLLIAMPGMEDPNFATTVTLICEHNDDGALGIVINRPLRLDLAGLYEQLDLQAASNDAGRQPVMSGGPIGTERGFVLHDPGATTFENSIAVSGDILLTVSRDILDAMAAGSGPAHALVALGYAGWQPGQLEAELLANSWLTTPATPDLVFETPVAERWTRAAESMGIDLTRLAPDAGHA